MEGLALMDNQEVQQLLLRKGFSQSAMPLLVVLQRVHDQFEVSRWESELAQVAEKFHLTLPPLETE